MKCAILNRVLGASIIAASFSLSGFAKTPSDPHRPNILMILVDDMGIADLGCYGSNVYQTPNIDQLAVQGVRFTEAYAAAHICSPTRASILTGKYPARLHLTDWIPGHNSDGRKLLIPEWTKELKHKELTIGEYLKKQGYTTAWFGKWHVGGGGAKKQGFDAGKQDWGLNKKEDDKDPKGVFTLNKQAIEFIEKEKEAPFFVCVSHYAVHTPVRFGKKLKKKYDKQGVPKKFNAGYCAMVEVLDESVGQLLDWLDDAGLARNTMVVLYSDNGGLTKYTVNGPYRDGKGTLYEGGTRVPMIVRWPGVVKASSETSAMVSSIDLLPTFLDSVGAPPPEGIDGVSLLPVLTKQAPLARDTLYWHYPHYHKGLPGGSIRKGDYKLLEFFEDGKVELYNLRNDPSETTNLSKKMPEKSKELLDALVMWRKDVEAQMMRPNPDCAEE